MPAFMSPHPHNSYFRCRGIRLEYVGPNIWTAIADYSTAPLSVEEEEKQTYPNPLDRLTKFSIDKGHRQEYRMKDANGKAYVNSAGEPFPAQPYNVSVNIVRVRKNVSAWTPSWFNLDGTVNDSQVTISDGYSSVIIPEERGLLVGPRMSELQREDNYLYYTLGAEIHVINNGDDKWKKIIIDSGFNCIGEDGKLKRIQVYDQDEKNFVDCVTEQLLNGSGKPLYGGGIYNPAVDPYELKFVDNKPANWSYLPFFS